MKKIAAIFLVLFLSIPAAWAGAVDGKGIWCPLLSSESFTKTAFGYWFDGNKATSYLIEGYGIESEEPFYYSEIHDSHIELDLDEWLLDRQTLKLGPIQCHLVSSLEELLVRLQAVIDETGTIRVSM